MWKIYIIFCSFWVTLFACNTPKKLNKIMDKLPEAAAKECAVRYPIVEKVDTLTVIDSSFSKMKEMEFAYLYRVVDSLLGAQVNDSIKNEIITIIQEKKVPIVKYKYITKTQESSASAQVIRDSCQKVSSLLNKKLDSLNDKLVVNTDKLQLMTDKSYKYKSQRNRYLWIIVLLFILLFRKPIMRVFQSLIKPL